MRALTPLWDLGNPALVLIPALDGDRLRVWVACERRWGRRPPRVAWACVELVRRGEFDWRPDDPTQMQWTGADGSPGVFVPMRVRESSGIDSQVKRIGPLIQRSRALATPPDGVSDAEFFGAFDDAAAKAEADPANAKAIRSAGKAARRLSETMKMLDAACFSARANRGPGHGPRTARQSETNAEGRVRVRSGVGELSPLPPNWSEKAVASFLETESFADLRKAIHESWRDHFTVEAINERELLDFSGRLVAAGISRASEVRENRGESK
jgi:hypothetical protein